MSRGHVLTTEDEMEDNESYHPTNLAGPVSDARTNQEGFQTSSTNSTSPKRCKSGVEQGVRIPVYQWISPVLGGGDVPRLSSAYGPTKESSRPTCCMGTAD
ncbi:uncharacterized protein P884DRAFT_128863 [Thermothelomyces heterothallicus CBS 202.75]|uniref:uncharacterized protein n=1 Tax=Thermothelomyces heterothallicus CBS 202.75 TaxID=1149848 RepID=UPI0037423358